MVVATYSQHCSARQGRKGCLPAGWIVSERSTSTSNWQGCGPHSTGQSLARLFFVLSIVSIVTGSGCVLVEQNGVFVTVGSVHAVDVFAVDGEVELQVMFFAVLQERKI